MRVLDVPRDLLGFAICDGQIISEQRVEFGERGAMVDTPTLVTDVCRPERAAKAMIQGGLSPKYVEKQ